MSVLILDEAELRTMVGFDRAALDVVEASFVALHEGRAMMPPIMHLEVSDPPGDIDIKSAVIAGLPSVAVKIAAGFFGNRQLGLPNSTALMIAMSARTGQCEAVLLDNGYLTDLRTALAGAVAARYLARPGPLAIGVIGAGVQARYQVEALMIERRVASVHVFAPRTEQLDAYCAEMRVRLGVDVRPCRSVQDVVEAADLVVTTTSAREPVLRGIWLRPGQHVTAMGSDLPGKRELDFAALARADMLVCDSIEQSRRLGELQGAADQAERAITLGSIIRDPARGRSSTNEITVCDLSGMGVQDTAILNHVLAINRSKEC